MPISIPDNVAMTLSPEKSASSIGSSNMRLQLFGKVE
jgi:hypothetical protein